MPYASNAEVPPDVKRRFKGHCLTVWREAWNDTFDRHNNEKRAFATAEQAGQQCMEARKGMNAVKFVEGSDEIIEGIGIPFGGPAYLRGKDFDGESFEAGTDFATAWYKTRPLLYHHGMDPEIGPEKIGEVFEAKTTDAGIWVRTQLDKAHRYYEFIKQLVDQQALGFSSGAVPHLVKTDKDGRIKQWPWVELSLTPTPANPNAIAYTVKASEALEHLASVDADIPEPLAAALKALDEWADSTPDNGSAEPLADRLQRVTAEVEAVVEHANEHYEMKTKAGKPISKANRERLSALRRQLDDLGQSLDAFLAEADPERKKAQRRQELELLRLKLEALPA